MDRDLWLFAGLYERWDGEDGQGETTFTIITTDSNEAIAPIHDRMPVILDDDAADEWLFAPEDDTDRLRSLLVPAPSSSLMIEDANPAVGNVRNEGPEMLRLG